VIVRRHPTAACWSWALEWNHNARIVGFVGESTTIQELVDQLTPPEQSVMRPSDGTTRGVREEIPLAEESDILFEL
jgi:hypothetical protein